MQVHLQYVVIRLSKPYIDYSMVHTLFNTTYFFLYGPSYIYVFHHTKLSMSSFFGVVTGDPDPLAACRDIPSIQTLHRLQYGPYFIWYAILLIVRTILNSYP